MYDSFVGKCIVWNNNSLKTAKIEKEEELIYFPLFIQFSTITCKERNGILVVPNNLNVQKKICTKLSNCPLLDI